MASVMIMPIRLCDCGFSGAMRTALRACISASAIAPFFNKARVSSLVAQKVLERDNPAKERVGSALPPGLGYGITSFARHPTRRPNGAAASSDPSSKVR
jgi:hypothetical protein